MNEWISTGERLPEIGQQVQVCKEGEPIDAWLIDPSGRFADERGSVFYGTRWRPIPLPELLDDRKERLIAQFDEIWKECGWRDPLADRVSNLEATVTALHMRTNATTIMALESQEKIRKLKAHAKPPLSLPDKGPFFIGESSCWPHPDGAIYGVRHKEFGAICDFRNHGETQRVRDLLNDIWVSDKGSKSDD